MLLLRHTPYLTNSADILALATSMVLALTLLMGYVLTATNAFLKNRPEDLKEAVGVMDTFLIVINAIPFVIFLLSIVIRNVCKKKNVKKGDGAFDEKKQGNTKIIPDRKEESGFDVMRRNFWRVHPMSNELKLTEGGVAMEAGWNNWDVRPVSNELKLTEGGVAMEAGWNNWDVRPVSNEVKLTKGGVAMENTKSSIAVVPSAVVQNGSLPALGRKKKAKVKKGSIHFGD